MIQNLNICNSFLENIISRACNLFIFIHTHQWTSSEFFYSRFSSRKFQGQQKLARKDHSFYNTVSLKTPHSFYEHQLTWRLKEYSPKTLPKIFLTLQIFQQTCSCMVAEKAFALHHFMTSKNCILEAPWKQMSVYFCISL